MRTTLLVISTLAMWTTVALAADQAPSGSRRAACKEDIAKFCPGIHPGGGRIPACLKQNEAQLSSACKDAIANSREKNAPQKPTSPPE
jgi:hypothetical protein